MEILKKYSDTKEIVLVTNSHKKRAIVTLVYYELFDKIRYKFYYYKEKTNKYKYEKIYNSMQ
jgi:hypothetical protein